MDLCSWPANLMKSRTACKIWGWVRGKDLGKWMLIYCLNSKLNKTVIKMILKLYIELFKMFKVGQTVTLGE